MMALSIMAGKVSPWPITFALHMLRCEDSSEGFDKKGGVVQLLGSTIALMGSGKEVLA